jgi:hypothetical protein
MPFHDAASARPYSAAWELLRVGGLAPGAEATSATAWLGVLPASPFSANEFEVRSHFRQTSFGFCDLARRMAEWFLLISVPDSS